MIQLHWQFKLVYPSFLHLFIRTDSQSDPLGQLHWVSAWRLDMQLLNILHADLMGSFEFIYYESWINQLCATKNKRKSFPAAEDQQVCNLCNITCSTTLQQLSFQNSNKRNKHFQRTSTGSVFVYCVCIFPTVLYYIKDTLMGLNVRCICDAIRSEYEMTSGKQQPAHIIWQWLNLLLHTNFMETVPQDPRSHRGWFVSSKSIRSRLLLRVLIVCALDHVNTASRRNILVRSFLASCCTMVPPVLSIAYA